MNSWIAKIIREGRERLNLNQSQLARRVGVSPQAVQQWEAGETQPRGKRLNKIAEVLQLNPELAHFGAAVAAAGSAQEGSGGKASGSAAPLAPEGAAGGVETISSNDALVREVVKAMQHMSREDAERLVTISKAFARGTSAEEPEAGAIKPLPVPAQPAHPHSSFPTRRLPAPAKARGKTAIR
jgi:HTH-type transcriptional regulator, cell division transcriptional repressor